MSAIETMRRIGRPIAYHPALARYVGGVNAAIFLCQLIYWDEKADNEDLGTYKTAEEWESETGLSYREQAGARKKLRDLGLLIETTQRLQHRIYYKLDNEAFDALMESASDVGNTEIRQSTNAQFPNDENAFREQPKAQFGGDAKRSSSNDENAVRHIDIDYTETTAETTTTTPAQAPADASGPPESKPSPAKPKSSISLPTWLPADAWAMWDEFRRAKSGRGWTQGAKQLSIRDLGKLHDAGHDLQSVIEQSIQRGWTGLFETKQGSSSPGAGQSEAQRRSDWSDRMNAVIAQHTAPPIRDLGDFDASGNPA